jgi:hypothetical protein
MMTKQEARDLEAKLASGDGNALVRRMGTIKITDVKSGESEIHATFAAADVLKLLNEGRDIHAVISILKRAEEQLSHGD